MTRRIQPIAHRPAAARRGCRLAAAFCAAALLAGCTTVSGMFEDEPEEVSRVSVPAESQGEQPFPNLATVPDEAPETSTSEEREALQEGLVADRANAEYTDQLFGDQPSGQPEAAVPPAAAPPAPEPAAGTGEASAPPAPEMAAPEPSSSDQAAEAAGSVQSQPLAPPEPAATPEPAPQPGVAPPAPASTPAAVPSPVPPPPPQALANGSVTVNPGAAVGDGAPAASQLLPSGESRPAALIFFGHGSARLARADIAVLKEVVKLYEQHGGMLRVVGHASRGTAGGDVAKQNMANLNISLARANAVAGELSRLGVPIDRIQVAAAGAQQPLFYETRATGEAGNRRVEIYLDY